MAVPLSASDEEARERLEIDLLLEAIQAFALKHMKRYAENYLLAGGSESFSSYYVADSDQARFDRTLAEGVVFA